MRPLLGLFGRDDEARAVRRDVDAVARGGLLEFVRLAWHLVESRAFVEGPHHALICRELERGGDLVISIPPGFTKSLIASVLFPAWLWTQDPTLRIASVSHVPTLSAKHARLTRDLVASDWYAARWRGVGLDPNSAAADYTNSAGGSRFAIGIEGGLTGYRFDRLLVDDPCPANPSKATVESAGEWLTKVRSTRLESGGATVIIAQRVHEADPSAVLLEQPGCRSLVLPMRAEDNDPLGREPGALLWPALWPEERVAKLERELGPAQTACQLQQRPAPVGGLIFRSEWLQTRVGPAPRCHQYVISVDASFNARATSDYAVVQIWGKSGSEFHLLDQWRQRATMPETVAAILDMRARLPGFAAILVESAANGHAIMQVLAQMRVSGVIPVTPKGDKVQRANAIVPLFHALNVWLPPPHEAPWIGAYRHELETFPRGANDDQCDATSQALGYLAGKGAGRPDLVAAMGRLGGDISRIFQ